MQRVYKDVIQENTAANAETKISLSCRTFERDLCQKDDGALFQPLQRRQKGTSARHTISSDDVP